MYVRWWTWNFYIFTPFSPLHMKWVMKLEIPIYKIAIVSKIISVRLRFAKHIKSTLQCHVQWFMFKWHLLVIVGTTSSATLTCQITCKGQNAPIILIILIEHIQSIWYTIIRVFTGINTCDFAWEYKAQGKLYDLIKI